MVELTAQQQRFFDQYTLKQEVGGQYSVYLDIGVQRFSINHPNCEDEGHADWLRAMLAKALVTLTELEHAD